MKMPVEYYEHFRKIASRGGKATARRMTKQQRSERARLAAASRWNKKGTNRESLDHSA